MVYWILLLWVAPGIGTGLVRAKLYDKYERLPQHLLQGGLFGMCEHYWSAWLWLERKIIKWSTRKGRVTIEPPGRYRR